LKDFSTIACPLKELTKKNVPFLLGQSTKNALDEIKKETNQSATSRFTKFCKNI
jgi:hypothetical protein